MPAHPSADEAPTLGTLAALVGAPAAFEAVLRRITGGPLGLSDWTGVAFAFASLVALCWGVRHAKHPAVPALAKVLIVATYGGGILVPLGLQFDQPAMLMLPMAGALAIAGLGGPVLRREPLRWGPRTVLGWTVGISAVAFLLLARRNALAPPVEVALPLLAFIALGLLLERWAGALVLAALVPGPSEHWTVDGPAPAAPDVVLISIDTLRLDAARSMASLQRLADQGVFLDAQAPSPWTLPSMVSLMTGLEPAHHAAIKTPMGFPRLSDDIPTLAEQLSAAGYDTAATAENPFTGPRFGLERGFARYRHDAAKPWALPQVPFTTTPRTTGTMLLAAAGLITPDDGIDLRLRDARELMASRRERPLFLWVHILEPHLPYTHALDLEGVRLAERLALLTANRLHAALPDEATLALYRKAYAHEVDVTNAALGTWLDELPPPPAAGRVIFVVADHGEAFGEHGGWEHGHSMYQEVVAVPMVISGLDGVVRQGPVGLIDVTPTVLALAGVPSGDLDGQDLRSHQSVPYTSSNPLYGDLTLRAVRMDDAKLIAQSDRRISFDLATDPDELSPGSQVALEPFLPPAVLHASESIELDDTTREQLRGLGYLE